MKALLGLTGVFCLFLGAALVWTYGPSVWRDSMVDVSTLEDATNYELGDGGCSSYAAVFIFCDMSFSHQKTAEVVEMTYLLSGGMDSTSVYAMQTPDDSWITSSLGMKYILNRMLSIIGLCVLLFGGGLMLLLKAGKKRSHV